MSPNELLSRMVEALDRQGLSLVALAVHRLGIEILTTRDAECASFDADDVGTCPTVAERKRRRVAA